MDRLPLDSKFVHWIQPYDQNVIANLIDANAMWSTARYKYNPVEDLTPRISDELSSTIHQYHNDFDAIGAFLRSEQKVANMEVDAKEVSWKLKGRGYFHAEIVEDVNEHIEFVGVGGSEFELKMNANWWDETDVIAPLSGITKINVQIIGKYQDGNNTVYRCILIDSSEDYNIHLDRHFITAGRKWCKLFSSSGEATSNRGSFYAEGEAPTYVELRNKLTHLQMKVKITDEALKQSQIIMSQDAKYARKVGDKLLPDPKQPLYLMSELEQKFIMQAKRQEQRALLYSRHNGNRVIDRSSSYVVDQGAGLYEFLRTGNTMEIPVTSYAIDMIIDAIQNRWFNKVAYGRRNVVIWTGEGGLHLAREFFDRKLIRSGAQLMYKDITSGDAIAYDKGYEGRRLQTSYVTEYQMFPWGTIKFAHLPLLDDLMLNADGPTYKGRPHSSYSFLIMDMGLGTGPASNLQMLKRRGMTSYSYLCGMWGPAGPLNNMRKLKGTAWNAAHAGNFFELHHDDWTGLILKDPSYSIFAEPALATV